MEQSHIRNFCIIAHIDHGKSTLADRLLQVTGTISDRDMQEQVLDDMDLEREKGVTIKASAVRMNYTAKDGQTYEMNLIDTPGHIDFTIEVERSLRVLDGAITIFSAVEGVQPQSESVWRQANRYQIPRICLINKMDRVGANYTKVLDEMRTILGATPVLLQLPLGEEDQFHGLIDLLNQQQF